MTLKNYQGAVDDYNSVLFVNIDNNEAYAYRGLAEAMINDTASMKADFTQAVKLLPKDDIVYVKRGAAKLYLNDPNGALQDFNTAIRLNPNSNEAYLRRGMEKIAQADKAGGCADLNKAVALGSKDAPELVKENCN